MSNSTEHAHDGHHVTPLKTYMGVYGALLVLTVLTYLVSFAGLGPAAVPVAMAVAIAKALLVVLFFMHLLHDDRFYSVVLGVSIFFMFLFFVGTSIDIGARGILTPEEGYFYKWREDAMIAASEAAATEEPATTDEAAAEEPADEEPGPSGEVDEAAGTEVDREDIDVNEGSAEQTADNGAEAADGEAEGESDETTGEGDEAEDPAEEPPAEE